MWLSIIAKKVASSPMPMPSSSLVLDGSTPIADGSGASVALLAAGFAALLEAALLMLPAAPADSSLLAFALGLSSKLEAAGFAALLAADFPALLLASPRSLPESLGVGATGKASETVVATECAPPLLLSADSRICFRMLQYSSWVWAERACARSASASLFRERIGPSTV